VAAVLLNPFYKSATFGGELSTATTARTTALAIIQWMVARGAPALVEAPSTPGDGASAPLTKRRKTFESYLFESTAPSGGTAVSAVVQPTFSLDAEWNAYRGRAVDPESQDTALDWWRAYEQHFPRVALGARYMLAIPATSVTSERVFSKAGRTVSKLRARMTGVNAEQFIVLATISRGAVAWSVRGVTVRDGRTRISGRMSVGGLLLILQDESGMTVGFQTWEAAGVKSQGAIGKPCLRRPATESKKEAPGTSARGQPSRPATGPAVPN